MSIDYLPSLNECSLDNIGVFNDDVPLLSSSLSVMARARAAVASGSKEGQKSSESVSVLPLSSSREVIPESLLRDFFPLITEQLFYL